LNPLMAPPAVVEDPLFCDLVTERFRWTQEEWDVRAARFPANLRREVGVNLNFDAECAEPTEPE